MTQTIQLRRSSTPGHVPASLADGEIGINSADKKLFYKDSGGTIQSLPLFTNAANGLAALDGSGKISTSILPAAVLGDLQYQGTWNATANSPALASGVGTKGYYYKVSVAGTTSVDGNAVWGVGDWIVYDGTAWDKIDNNNAISSVAGLTGAITAAALKTALAIANTDVSGLGTAATKTVGTAANNVVALDGAAKYPAADGSQITNLPQTRVLLATLTAANVAYLSYTALSTAYSKYEFEFDGLRPASNGAKGYMAVTQDAGATWKDSTNSAYGGSVSVNPNAGKWMFFINNMSSAAGGTFGSMWVNDPTATDSRYKCFFWSLFYYNAGDCCNPAGYSLDSTVAYYTANALGINGIKFFPSSGNWTDGVIRVWGWKTT
jgi:hypothetical protein